MQLLKLKNLPGQQSMLIFHALARMGFEGLVIVSPEKPLVSLGYFEDIHSSLDLDYCLKNRIPIMRREVGGGTTYLDKNQVFYQVIFSKKNSIFPAKAKEIFEFLSQPVCQTYEEFGINTHFRGANDIVTESGKKIAGEGGGDIGTRMVFVGGILMDFDYQAMAKLLKVPDEKFRDKVYKSMRENLTTMKKELSVVPERDDIVNVLVEKFERTIGKLDPINLDAEILDKMKQVEKWMQSREFLYRKDLKASSGVKIREGVEILYSNHKATGGLIKTYQEIFESRIQDIQIAGDFQFFPKEALDSMQLDLKNTIRSRKELKNRIEMCYERRSIETPQIEPNDIVESIMKD